VWDIVPHTPPSKLVNLDSRSGFYNGIPLMNSLKEMNEFYNVCKEDLVKENTIIRLYRGAKLGKFTQHNLNWVVNHIGLKNQKKHISVIYDISSESSYVPPQLCVILQWKSSMTRVRIDNH
jgi:hypothetical protein